MNAKKWFLIYIITIVISFIIVTIYNKPVRFSNSISYDSKLNFLHKNFELLSESSTIVIGASLSLNNIDSSYLSKENFGDVINVSSWGLRPHEVLQLLKLINLSKKKYVIYSLQYVKLDGHSLKNVNTDEVEKYLNNEFSFYPYILKYKTFMYNFPKYMKYKKVHMDKNKYRYLNFDENGDVNFDFDNDSYINQKRWNNDYKSKFKKENYKAFIDINNFLKKQGIKFILVTSPLRQAILKKLQKKSIFNKHIIQLDKMAQKENFMHINAHEILELNDTYFVDSAHLNIKGASSVSKLINNRISLME